MGVQVPPPAPDQDYKASIMIVTVEDLSTVKKVLHIEVPAEDVVREFNSAYAELKKSSKVKGFRPGKVPRSVLERLFGKRVNAEVRFELTQSAFNEAVGETGLTIVGSPEIDPPELKDRTAFAFEVIVEVRPKIEDIEYKGLKLEKTVYEVSEEDVAGQLAALQNNFTKHRKIDEARPLAEGDVAIIDYEGFKTGEPFAAARKTENLPLKVGAGRIVKELDSGLLGMRAGEERDIEVSFDKEYFKKELAGQELILKVKLNEIREEVVPELDDEFARSISDKFDSLESLKTMIKEDLLEGYQKRSEQELNEQVFQHLLAQTDFEVPESLVEYELGLTVSDTERSIAQNNRTLEDVGLTKEGLEEKYRPTAKKQVRRFMIMEKLIEQESLSLSDEEMDQGLQDLADTTGQPIEKVKEHFDQKMGRLEYLERALLEKKALKLIMESSQIMTVEPKQQSDAPTEDTGGAEVVDQA